MMPACTRLDFPQWAHSKGGRLSYLRSQDYDLAVDRVPMYNLQLKSESFQGHAADLKECLTDIMKGKAVTLAMTVEPKAGSKRKIAASKPIPVVVIPGRLFGADSRLLLVAVVGKGSTVLYPFARGALSSLVLSGMPARLAQRFLNEVINLPWSH